MAASTLARWRESMAAPFEWGGGFFPLFAPEIRIEQIVDDGMFQVRAEIPGVDPEKDLEVSVEEGALKIRVERSEESRDKAHSEFHYGRFMRSVALPIGAMEDSAAARYVNGVLEVSFKLGEPAQTARRVMVEVPKKKA
jgi:HSP20 family protein